jgi:hypothetical protein
MIAGTFLNLKRNYNVDTNWLVKPPFLHIIWNYCCDSCPRLTDSDNIDNFGHNSIWSTAGYQRGDILLI